jgi:hypothetical protein
VTWRAVIVYWVLALVVAAQLGWTLRSRERQDAVQPAAVAPIVEAPASAIDDLLAQRGERALEFRKDDGRWQIQDTGAVVSCDLVAAFLDTLTTIPPIEIIPEGSADLAAYGLAPPQAIVRMAGAGQPVATLELGERNPTRTAVYARRPDQNRVYLLGLNAQYYLDLIFEQAAGRAPAGAS